MKAIHAGPKPVYLKIISSYASTAIMNSNFKSLLDSADKTTNPQMDGMVLMAAQYMVTMTPILLLRSAWGIGCKFHWPILLARAWIIIFGSMTKRPMPSVKSDRDGWGFGGQRDDQQVKEAAPHQECARCFWSQALSPDYWQCKCQYFGMCPSGQDTAHYLAVPSSPLCNFATLGDEFIKAWHERHNSDQPQFWI